ncbi:MAG: FkbM family methyltransferase, partial [bacterium]
MKSGFLSRAGREMRSLIDQPYRRAYRSMRHLPHVEYRSVIDGGANQGAFTDAFLRLHNPDRVILVEPIPDLAEGLRIRFAQRRGVSVVAAALSDHTGNAEFEINRSSASSSLLKIDPRNTGWFGRDLRVARKLDVPTLTLPKLMSEQRLETIDLLKLDLQGAERFVLSGGETVLPRIHVIYTEVFFEALYAGAWLFWDTNAFLCAHGFKLCGLSNIVHARDGDLVQANATFRRQH